MSTEKRRIVVTLEINGSAEDAQAIQDAVGEAIDDEFISAVILSYSNRPLLRDVKWTVKGERWESAPSPTPDQIKSAMRGMNIENSK